MGRRGIAGGRSHRRHGFHREVVGAAGPRADQHRPRRHPARRRHDGHCPGRCPCGKEAIAKNRDFIVGVKARLSDTVAGKNDFEVLRRAQEVASSFNLPVMIHMGQTVSPLPRLINLLKRGDIVTHMFAPPPNSIIDDSGHILPEVLAARRRGVWFDVGNGQSGHMRWDTVDRIMQAGFWPDTFSTDWNVNSPKTGVIDFPNCMSKFLELGMSLDQVIARATVNPSRVFPLFNDRGTLNVGAPADVAVLELRQGTFEFLDNYENKRAGKQRLFRAEPCSAASGFGAPRIRRGTRRAFA
jgi:dihydroorotase